MCFLCWIYSKTVYIGSLVAEGHVMLSYRHCWEARLFCMVGPDCFARQSLRGKLNISQNAGSATTFLPPGCWTTFWFRPEIEHYEDSGECKNINDGKKEWRLLGNPMTQGLPGCSRLRPKKSVSAAAQFCRDCLSGRLRYEDILGWNPLGWTDRDY